MNRSCLDPRVWTPIAIAALCFSFRLHPPAAPAAADPARPVALPAMQPAPPPKSDVDYVLDPAKSTVRFLVEGSQGELLTTCTRVEGRLRLTTKGEGSEFELELDLGSLAPSGTEPTTIDLYRLLGVHRGSEVRYRGTLLRTSTTNLPSVTERVWLGTLRIGPRIVRQPMQLWQCALSGQPMRLQGHGTVDVADYGLPRRSWLGLLQENHVVTLGLDLAWRRSSPR